MATSRSPLLADDHNSLSSSGSRHHGYDHDERTHLYGAFTTSLSRPFSTSFHPTLFTRTLALLLAFPAFVVFTLYGPRYAPAIVFLSFAIARQLVVLGAHLGSQVMVIRIEVTHPRLRAASAKAQEKWIKKSFAGGVDAVILVGLLVSLSLVASYRPLGNVKAADILGFVAFALLLVSVPDLGTPSLVTLAVAVERPAKGLYKLATSVLHGELDEEEDSGENNV